MVNLFPLIPLTLTVLFVFKVIFIYLLAVYYGHVNPLYPYLSDSGTTHPEAGYFSMILILDAILFLVFGWIRFKQIRYVFANISSDNNNKTVDNNQINKYNKYSLYISVVNMLGTGTVAAFRSTEHVFLHIAGAAPAFVGMFLYYMIQTWFSYKMIPTVNSKRKAHFRLIITIFVLIVGLISGLAIIVQAFTTTMSHSELLTAARLKLDESDGGYVAHYISAIAENLIIVSIAPFYASFISEFRRISSQNGRLKFNFIGQSNTENIAI